MNDPSRDDEAVDDIVIDNFDYIIGIDLAIRDGLCPVV